MTDSGWEWINFSIFVGLTLLIGGALLLMSWRLGPRRPLPEKLDPYECGVPLLDSSRQRFTVKFYLVAILFMLFDIEAVFLIPWGVVYQALASPLAAMFVFLGVLGFGLVYVIRRGVLDWN
jgi:NADH-quinone oxidoreductase subunit A